VARSRRPHRPAQVGRRARGRWKPGVEQTCRGSCFQVELPPRRPRWPAPNCASAWRGLRPRPAGPPLRKWRRLITPPVPTHTNQGGMRCPTRAAADCSQSRSVSEPVAVDFCQTLAARRRGAPPSRASRQRRQRLSLGPTIGWRAAAPPAPCRDPKTGNRCGDGAATLHQEAFGFHAPATTSPCAPRSDPARPTAARGGVQWAVLGITVDGRQRPWRRRDAEVVCVRGRWVDLDAPVPERLIHVLIGPRSGISRAHQRQGDRSLPTKGRYSAGQVGLQRPRRVSAQAGFSGRVVATTKVIEASRAAAVA